MQQTADSEIEIPFDAALSERYLVYALSTITARSLPDVRDGLKPVHRRLLWAMRLLKLDPSQAYKKCARVVGDVIGKFHPHGDVAVYDALVRLAQGFAARYPLVEGQGNFGNIDGDNPAAMRYTEARLTEVARAMLAGIDEDRLPEERSRGITVDPGLIDAPGHEWPMWTMLAGATGVAGQRCALNLVGVRLGKDGVADSGSRLDVRALEEPAFLGRLALIRIYNGRLRKGQQVAWMRLVDGAPVITSAKITELLATEGVERTPTDEAVAAPAEGRTSMFAALGQPNYRIYFAGAFVSNIGTWMQRVAQDWLVLLLTNNSGTSAGSRVASSA